MRVYFIGAGPGAPDLLTLRGDALVRRCPLCLYAGALVPNAIVELAPAGARCIDTQHMTLEQITAEFLRAKAEDADVARLHSGDISLYSAAAEQMAALFKLEIAFEIVPGVPAFSAAAATLGRELTLPGVAQSVVLTRFGRRGSKMPDGEKLSAFAQTGATLVLHLSVTEIGEITTLLTPYYGAGCPAAVVVRASWPDEQVLQGQLDTIAAKVRELGVVRTALILVGPALDGARTHRSHLYSQARAMAARKEDPKG